MPRGYLSLRINHRNRAHHIYSNNGVFWVHYTLHFDFRKRRIRRSLGTRDAAEAVRRRDELFARLARDGEHVPERRPAPRPPASNPLAPSVPNACLPAASGIL
jgi:hypothetical protein